MESSSGVNGVKELKESGTPIEIFEGDGDNTLISRLNNDLNMTVQKRFDRNHVVKNIGKTYGIHHNKNKKTDQNTIKHLQRCLKYCFAKNQGNPLKLRENVQALIPHQFIVSVNQGCVGSSLIPNKSMCTEACRIKLLSRTTS